MDKQCDTSEFPLYTPHTKKMGWNEIADIVPQHRHQHIKKWLTSPEHYRALMRNVLVRSRRVFKNKISEDDEMQIVEAGIMSLVTDGSNSAAYVSLKMVQEEKKKRRRLILETRCIACGA